jgi:Probable cobalt transporter subunit (CbtA)
MLGALLLRGMLAGSIAGLLCFGFLKIAGEPQVDRAIAFEDRLDAAKSEAAARVLIAKGLPASSESAQPELVSRRMQAGIGLFTGVLVYNAAFGGLFALAFALAYGRIGDFGPRATAALLAALGLVAVYIVPNLKYPANPPSVGDLATIGRRTALYFSMIAISLAAMIAAGMLRRRLLDRFVAWNAFLIAATAYLTIVIGVGVALPSVNEVPGQFPAVVLWQFRIASFGAQLIMWATIGLVFGALAERASASQAAGGGRPGAGVQPSGR